MMPLRCLRKVPEPIRSPSRRPRHTLSSHTPMTGTPSLQKVSSFGSIGSSGDFFHGSCEVDDVLEVDLAAHMSSRRDFHSSKPVPGGSRAASPAYGAMAEISGRYSSESLGRYSVSMFVVKYLYLPCLSRSSLISSLFIVLRFVLIEVEVLRHGSGSLPIRPPCPMGIGGISPDDQLLSDR